MLLRSNSLAEEFVAKWARIAINERAVAQSHFNDLCALLRVPAPDHSDHYRFEKPLTKVGGSAGFADVWRRDHFAWEYKSKNRYRDLRDAYQQLLLYKEDLDNPPVLAACDIARYEIHVVYTGYKTRIEPFTNADLANAATREVLYLALTDPVQLRPAERAETVTTQAAARVAQVAQMLERRGIPPEQVAAFFTKLLFAFFAEDIRLLPNHVLSESLRHAIFKPDQLPEILRGLFRTMQSGGYFGPLTKIPHINGGLFADDSVIPLTVDEIQFLADAARLDWAQVDPTIFGTLFERSLDPRLRAQLGLHYTSKDDILLLVEPVLMQPLRREWDAVRAETDALRLQAASTSGSGKQRLRAQIEQRLYDFADRLCTIRVLDPACGAGNFLYVALQQLKDLEKQVIVYAHGIGVEPPALGVSPAQCYGIEKNPTAAKLAQVVVWIGYIQWLHQAGFADHIQEPVLQHLDTIQCRDAILEVDAAGRPVEPQWPVANAIIGNPPFLGDKKMRGELGDDYVALLRRLYVGRVPGGADLVAYWFERARVQIEQQRGQRAGLLATNSIAGGLNRRVLDAVKQSGGIFWAWNDRPWVLEGAAVRVAMIGFDDGSDSTRMLNGLVVSDISADLKGDLDLTTARRLIENRGIAFIGDSKKGSFEISEEQAIEMSTAPNQHALSNKDVIRRNRSRG
jgi:hypothetical protein